jgi:hypothetical protein
MKLQSTQKMLNMQMLKAHFFTYTQSKGGKQDAGNFIY